MDISTISTFFNRNVDKDIEFEKFWKNLCFITTNEWHWSQEDFYNTDIPYIFLLLEVREEYIKEQNKKR